MPDAKPELYFIILPSKNSSHGTLEAYLSSSKSRVEVKCQSKVYYMCTMEKISNLVYCLREMKKVECDTNYLSVDNTKGIGYSERRIKKIYYRKPNLPFEDSLVSIESDEEVRELIVLSKNFEYVSLYVEHNNEHPSVVFANNGNESNDADSDCMADNKYKEYRSEVEDEEVAWGRGEKKRMHDDGC
ncbi:hypothetical protein Cgig2_028243 [Carnegiea gigantea]|uniref:Uncharacterized protein n=1 Tax=Carnegiea gigantea TaxID=171969 RepID=A0A9Q1KHF5_9CARY|nr:hypothetical protein Cgig2_028243 [Carnegiea gigantea]